MLVIKRMEFTHCTQLKTMMTSSYTIGDIYVNVRLEKLSQQKPGVLFAVHLILCKYQGDLFLVGDSGYIWRMEGRRTH